MSWPVSHADISELSWHSLCNFKTSLGPAFSIFNFTFVLDTLRFKLISKRSFRCTNFPVAKHFDCFDGIYWSTVCVTSSEIGERFPPPRLAISEFSKWQRQPQPRLKKFVLMILLYACVNQRKSKVAVLKWHDRRQNDNIWSRV